MTRGAFKAATLPRHPVDATHAVKAAGSVPPIYTIRVCLKYFLRGGMTGLALGMSASRGLRGIGPALADKLKRRFRRFRNFAETQSYPSTSEVGRFLRKRHVR